jgi:type II secretion system protein G
MHKQKGFTIVELLIVIVIIAILAAITVIAYNGVQNRSRDSARATSIGNIKKSLELYFIDEGRYPAACESANAGCNISFLSAHLVPKYMSAVPNDPQSNKPFMYVTNATGNGYGIRVEYHPGVCKHLGGANPNTSWWNAETPICS